MYNVVQIPSHKSKEPWSKIVTKKKIQFMEGLLCLKIKK